MITQPVKIKLTLNGSPKSETSGKTLSEYLGSERPCGGHGRCGKCKVIATGALSEISENEKKLLSEEELEKGYRLACTTIALGDCSIITVNGSDEDAKIVTDGEMPDIELKPSFKNYGVAIDIGTTTVAARLYSKNATILSQGSMLNPQSVWGADVISRIEADINGKSRSLALSIRSALNEIITDISKKASVSPELIDFAVITGNTVMLYLLTQCSTEPLSHAPFNTPTLFSKTFSAQELELNSLQADTKIYLPPCISAFVGADITCGILACGLCNSEEPALLVDIGTNGEMALWSSQKLTVCSTAAGPAFEGVGISNGMRGAPGAIDKVIIQNGKLSANVIDGVKAKGICGSGLVDAASCILQLEIMDESGYLEDDEVQICDGISISQSDIRMLQLAKSAICAGMQTLIKTASLSPSDISRAYTAGGFGKYLNMNNAAIIGLIPNEIKNKFRAIGNAALTGASMLLLNTDMQNDITRIAENAENLELSTDPFFAESYMMGMLFQ